MAKKTRSAKKSRSVKKVSTFKRIAPRTAKKVRGKKVGGKKTMKGGGYGLPLEYLGKKGGSFSAKFAGASTAMKPVAGRSFGNGFSGAGAPLVK